MSRAEKFIEENTRNCSQLHYNSACTLRHCITPDQAIKAVEIAREEMIKKACDAYCKVCGHYAHKTPTYICRHACDYFKDFEQAIKDE